jgi:protein phosphatase 1 regulatory subunit 16A
LHKASRFERLDIAKLLLDYDADVDAQKQDDWTPLHLAVGNHYLEIVKVLLERCARVDLLNDEGRTPHDVALRRGAGDIADLLSKYMAHGA